MTIDHPRPDARVRRFQLRLLVSCRNLRGRAEAVKGADLDGEGGANELIEQLIAALDGRRFPDASARPLLVEDVEPILIAEDACQYDLGSSVQISE
jgi:hypothetical protein